MPPSKLAADFLKAARNGDTAKIAACLAAGADVDHSHNLALGLAAKNGHREVAELLIAHGADPKDPDALRWAAQDNRRETVLLLLENGADFDNIPKMLQTRFRADWNRLRENRAEEKAAHEQKKQRQKNADHRNLRRFIKKDGKP